MNTYLVIENVRIKVGNDIKEFQRDRVIKLTEQSAKRLLVAGKIRPLYELQPASRQCKRCGRPAVRFCYDIFHKRFEPACNWFCLVCEPFIFN